MSKDKDLKYIKDFSKITVSGVCKELNINRANVLNGRASSEGVAAVKKRIKDKLNELDN